MGLLRWYCYDGVLEEIEGDLYESLQEEARVHGAKVARRRYLLRVIQFIKPFTLKRNPKQLNLNTFPMVKNNIIIAYRSLVKKMGYTLVNIFGLSVGLACCLMIMIYVDHETSYDEFQNSDVYRIVLNRKYPDREANYTIVPHSVAPQLVEDFPFIVAHGSIQPPFGTTTVRYEDKFFDEPYFTLGDSALLDVIKFEFIIGDPNTALRDVNTIVISESTAKKYFKDEDPLNKSLETNFGNWSVVGVFKDYPEKSHFRADLIAEFWTATRMRF